MRYNSTRARYETELSKAHRALFNALTCAGAMSEQGAEIDLELIMREVTRLAQDSLSPKRKGPRAAEGLAPEHGVQLRL